MRTMKLVYIEWFDAYGCSSTWQDMPEIKPSPIVCKSVGWLLHDGDDCKVIVPHTMPDDHDHANPQGCGDMTIPTVAIKRIVEMKEPVVKASLKVLHDAKRSKKAKLAAGLSLTQKGRN